MPPIRVLSGGLDDEGVQVGGQDRPAGPDPLAVVASEAATAQVVARLRWLIRPSQTMSPTRSSLASPGSTTTSLRPCADSAASRYSTPRRASRSRCSTTIMAARGSASTRRSLGRRPLTPGPTSVATSAAVTPCAVAPPQQPGDLPTQLATLLVGGDSRVQHRASIQPPSSSLPGTSTSTPTTGPLPASPP